MADVNITLDGKKLTAPAGTLLIEACKNAGIEVPSFCYYPGFSLQGACRMCLVKIEKVPKLQTACTTVIGEGMIVTTDSPEIHQARKSMVELLLGNHPLDGEPLGHAREAGVAHALPHHGIAERAHDRVGQRARVARRYEHPGLAVHHDLRDPAG